MFIAIAAISFAACTNNQASNSITQTESIDTKALYACPMHPEATGIKGDKCPKCGMELSVPVKHNESIDNDSFYACSMHMEITGKKGDKCSKCGMELTVPVKHNESGHNHGEGTQKPATSEMNKSTTSIAAVKTGSNPLSDVYSSYFDLKNALTKDDGKAAQSAANNLYDNISQINAATLSPEENAIWTKYKKKLSFDAEHIKGVDVNEHQREHFISLSKNMHEVMKVIKNDKTVYYQHCPMANDGKGANWLSLDSKISNPYFGKSMPNCGTTLETLK